MLDSIYFFFFHESEDQPLSCFLKKQQGGSNKDSFLKDRIKYKKNIKKRIKEIKKRLDGLRPKKGPCAQAWSSPCVWIYLFSFFSL